ncbi:MAG: hypothetical protein K5893_06875 [Prevotella sp.]|nr:hypothetical protein [Prevotella sp.]
MTSVNALTKKTEKWYLHPHPSQHHSYRQTIENCRFSSRKAPIYITKSGAISTYSVSGSGCLLIKVHFSIKKRLWKPENIWWNEFFFVPLHVCWESKRQDNLRGEKGGENGKENDCQQE